MQPSPDHGIIQRLARRSTISNKNANRENWEWKVESKSWMLAEERWQVFHASWYGATEKQFTSPDDPKSPSLSLEPLSLPYRFQSKISSSIFVRESYVTMFDTVWAQAIGSEGTQGVIITGQPGTGKTLFDYYLLARLLQRKQVILFSPDGKNVHLFYFDKVYTADMDDLAAKGIDVSLPEPKSNGFIWSIFDINSCKEPAEFLVTAPCCPVQTASPDPVRYKRWEKKFSPLVTGLPLWSCKELEQGLQYQYRYYSLLNALGKIYVSGSSNNIDEALHEFPGTCQLIHNSYNEETVPTSPMDVLKYVLDSAIYQFGYAARDVYAAVFNLRSSIHLHELAFEIDYEDLCGAVLSLSESRNEPSFTSHQSLAISPVNDQGPLDNVCWNVGFKSDWIARMLLQKLGEETEKKIHELISFLQNIPEGQALAQRMLEPLAHHGIPNPKTKGGFWTLLTMNSNNADPPQFSLALDSTVPDGAQLARVRRKVVKLQSVADLCTCLENNSYYILTDPNFPLVDAFITDLDHEKKVANLWLLKITRSQLHGGSKSYQKVREIIAILCDKLCDGPLRKKSKKMNAIGQPNPMPVVQVHYVLVISEDESQSQTPMWQFPKGWGENYIKIDHRGHVYCLELPL